MDKANFWEKQYRRGHGKIVGICYRYVNDWAVAQDLAQDVFLKAMETFKAYRAFGRFDAWLTRIAVNHCIDYLRQKPDFIALESEPAAERPDEDTEPIWTADFTEKELLETVQQLPDRRDPRHHHRVGHGVSGEWRAMIVTPRATEFFVLLHRIWKRMR